MFNQLLIRESTQKAGELFVVRGRPDYTRDRFCASKEATTLRCVVQLVLTYGYQTKSARSSLLQVLHPLFFFAKKIRCEFFSYLVRGDAERFALLR